MKKKINQIASIFAGYTFRTALKDDKNGTMSVIQARDVFSDNLYVDYSSLLKIDFKTARSNSLVEKYDVLISARGIFKASVFTEDNKNVISSSSNYIIRLKDKNILPEYLAIYFNSIVGQKEISKNLSGGTIKTILRKDLGEIEIKIVDLEKQKKIINLYQTSKKMQILLSRKKEIVNNISEASICNILK
ncbi:restriction endonuclease subunit S [Patescibacteria group bacterium]|nr:restriction endonuclease subunit S [Patescibacteria group bacterium]